MVEKKGRPYAVVISPEQYELLQQKQERAWATIDRVRDLNTDEDPDEILADVTAEVATVRQERHATRKGQAQSRR